MVSQFIGLEWKQFFRSTYWQKSIIVNLLLMIVALYFILIFLVFGYSLYSLLKEQFPDKNPLYKINDFLLYWIIADLFMRFFLQKLPVMSVKPLLTLPIKKSKIIRYLLNKSLLSFFNFLPLFAVIPFGLKLIFQGVESSDVLSWMFFMILLSLFNHFLNFFIEQKTSDSDWAFLPIVIIIVGLTVLQYFGILSICGLISSVVNEIISNHFLLVVPLIMVGSFYYLNYHSLIQKLYLDESLKVKADEVSLIDMSWTKKFGSIAPFLQLDLKLLWRNKRPRSSIFIIVIGLLYGLMFYTNPHYQEMFPIYIFAAIFITGVFLISFGQFIPAWDSAYYKLLMSQNVKYKDYLESKYVLMQWSAVILFVLSIPYVYFGWKILLFHLLSMFYNIGINTHILLYAGSFNRKKIDLTQRAAFNYQGTGAVQWLIALPLLLFPLLIFYIPYKFIGFEWGVVSLFIISLFGIVFHKKLMDIITKKYQKSKYEMINAFAQNE